jgi:hypothetical protein
MERSIIPQSDAIALYNVYRDYIKQENTLMNVRMTWFLTTQAFLFSSYALLNQKRISAGNFELVRSWQEFIGGITDFKLKFSIIILMLICFFGIFTARRSYISVRAASLAIMALRSKWNAEFARRGPFISLPAITGGGDDKAMEEGWASAAFLPKAAMVIWVLIAIMHGFLLRA